MPVVFVTFSLLLHTGSSCITGITGSSCPSCPNRNQLFLCRALAPSSIETTLWLPAVLVVTAVFAPRLLQDKELGAACAGMHAYT